MSVLAHPESSASCHFVTDPPDEVVLYLVKCVEIHMRVYISVLRDS